MRYRRKSKYEKAIRKYRNRLIQDRIYIRQILMDLDKTPEKENWARNELILRWYLTTDASYRGLGRQHGISGEAIRNIVTDFLKEYGRR